MLIAKVHQGTHVGLVHLCTHLTSAENSVLTIACLAIVEDTRLDDSSLVQVIDG